MINTNLDGLTHTMDAFRTSMRTLQQDISAVRLTENKLGHSVGQLHTFTQQIQQDVSCVRFAQGTIEHVLVESIESS